MNTLRNVLLRLLEFMVIGPIGMLIRAGNRPPPQPPMDLDQMMARAKQMDEEDARRREQAVPQDSVAPDA